MKTNVKNLCAFSFAILSLTLLSQLAFSAENDGMWQEEYSVAKRKTVLVPKAPIARMSYYSPSLFANFTMTSTGAKVIYIHEDSPLSGKVKVGDVITSLDGLSVGNRTAELENHYDYTDVVFRCADHGVATYHSTRIYIYKPGWSDPSNPQYPDNHTPLYWCRAHQAYHYAHHWHR